MAHRFFWLFGLLAAIQLSATPASAQSGACEMGARVIDRQQRSGTVVEAKGADCRVQLADGSVRPYLAWMLQPAPGKAPAPAQPQVSAPANGSYHCVAAGGLAGTLVLVIQDGFAYTDRSGKTGKYSLDAKTGEMVFVSGPWSGFFGKVLGPAKIGVFSRRGNYAGTVCDRK